MRLQKYLRRYRVILLLILILTTNHCLRSQKVEFAPLPQKADPTLDTIVQELAPRPQKQGVQVTYEMSVE